EYPDTWGKIALHPRNEGLLIKGQFQSVVRHQLEGMAKGAADIVIPGGRGGFVCELKRRDHTKSAWQDGQTAYLKASKDAGAFLCVALGAAAAWMAFQEWLGDSPLFDHLGLLPDADCSEPGLGMVDRVWLIGET